jgi:hypothetical protein
MSTGSYKVELLQEPGAHKSGLLFFYLKATLLTGSLLSYGMWDMFFSHNKSPNSPNEAIIFSFFPSFRISLNGCGSGRTPELVDVQPGFRRLELTVWVPVTEGAEARRRVY